MIGSRLFRIHLISCLVFLGVCLGLPHQSQAQITTPSESALKLAPKDASFYYSIANIEEQMGRLFGSKAFKSLSKSMSENGDFALDDFWSGMMQGADVPPEMAEWMAAPENQELVELFMDMFKQEMFVYGSREYAQWMGAYKELFKKSMEQLSNYDFKDLDAGIDKELLEVYLEFLTDERIKEMPLPSFVLGFKVKNTAAAKNQLRRITDLLKDAPPEAKEFTDQIKWESIAESDYLTLTLKSADIPWDQIESEMESELDEDQQKLMDAFKDLLEDRQLAIAVGVHDQYLVLSIGGNFDHLKNFGQGESLLTNEKLKSVKAVSDAPTVLTSYVSQECAENSISVGEMLTSYVGLIAGIANNESLLEEFGADDQDLELGADILSDLSEFMNDLSQFFPKPAASVTYVYLTPQGYQGFKRSWANDLFLDGSQKLDVLDHVGESPLMVFAGRKKHRPQDFKLVMKWLRKGICYFETIAKEEGLLEIEDPMSDPFEDFNRLVDRFEKNVEDNWLPAFKNGQSAFVIDDEILTRRPFTGAPRSSKRLRFPEPAIIAQIDDREKVKKGGAGFLDLLNRGIRLVEKHSGEDLMGLKIPNPEYEESDGIEYYYYMIGAMISGSDQFEPCAALTDRWLALTTSPKHARRLINGSSSDLGPFVNQFKDRKLASMAYVDFESTLTLAQDWTVYGVKAFNTYMDDLLKEAPPEAIKDFEERPVSLKSQDDGELEEAEKMIREVFRYCKCLKSYSGVYYQDGNSMVTEFELRFQDIEN